MNLQNFGTLKTQWFPVAFCRGIWRSIILKHPKPKGFYDIGDDTVDGKNPAPPGMYKTL